MSIFHVKKKRPTKIYLLNVYTLSTESTVYTYNVHGSFFLSFCMRSDIDRACVCECVYALGNL